MMAVIPYLFRFVFVTLLFHPLFVTFGALVLSLIILCRCSSRLTRHVEAADLLWFKSLPSSASIRLVWCDPFLQQENITEQLLRKIDRNLVLITDVTLCEITIRKLCHDECKSIFLILSGSVADDDELLTRVTADVHSIFIFCHDKTKHADLITRPKMDIVVDSPSILIERITDCLSSVERRFIDEHEQKSVRNLSKETGTFIWF